MLVAALCLFPLAAGGCAPDIRETASTAGTGTGAAGTGAAGTGAAGTGAAGGGGATGTGGSGGVGGSAGGSGGAPPAIAHPQCGDTSGLAPSAPWPMDAFCPTRHGRSPFTGPEMPSIVMAWAEGQDASSLAVAAGGTLFFGAQDMMDASRVFKLPGGADAGWPSVAGGSVEVAPALGADGTVYVVTKLGALQAFAPDGSVLWTLQLGAPESTPTSPVIGGDGTIYVASSDHMHAIAKEGVEKWSFPVQGASAAAIGFDGRLHFGSAEGALYVLDPDGMEHAHVDLAGPVRAPSIGADGTVYVSAGLSLHAIAEGGAVLWSYDVGGGADQAIAADGAVIAVGNGSVRALSPDGDLLWENGSVFGAPTIDAAGTIYVSLGHWVRAYTPDGTEKWTLEVDPILPIANPITIGEEGTLHVSGYNGVYTLAD